MYVCTFPSEPVAVLSCSTRSVCTQQDIVSVISAQSHQNWFLYSPISPSSFSPFPLHPREEVAQVQCHVVYVVSNPTLQKSDICFWGIYGRPALFQFNGVVIEAYFSVWDPCVTGLLFGVTAFHIEIDICVCMEMYSCCYLFHSFAVQNSSL